jgi:hypothetical protein
MSDDSIKKTTSYGRRAASYWFVDGLPELLLGLTLIVMAGVAFLFFMKKPGPWNGPWRALDILAIYAVFILYLFSERGVLDFLKAHFTYPRTGYVQPPEEKEWRVETLTTLSLLRPDPPPKENVTFFRLRTVWPILMVLVLFEPQGSSIGRWFAPCVTPAVAVALYVVNRESERPYRLWSSLILAVAGLVFVWVRVPGPLQWPLPFLLTGGWLAAQGGYRLVHYLRTNPYPRMAEGVKA